MITAFSLLLDRCGLSHREAAEFRGCSIESIRSWGSGRTRTPEAVIAQFRMLYAHIEVAAAEVLALIAAESAGCDIELGLASDDADARSLGWPCVGAHAAVFGIVAARCPRPVRIVPSVAPPASVSAADAHDFIP